MKKIHLINVDTSNGANEEAGTCELCFYTMWCDNPTFIFEMDGERLAIDGYWWDWGDYSEIFINNTVDFGLWLDTQEFADDTDFNTDWLLNIVDKYNRTVAQTEYKDINGHPIYMDSKIAVEFDHKQIEAHIGYDGYCPEISFVNPFTSKYEYLESDDYGNLKPYKVIRLEEHTNNKITV